MKYVELSDKEVLNQKEMFEVKGGYVCYNYGCNSNVCTSNIEDAKSLCTTAYCRSKSMPEDADDSSIGTVPKCIIFAKI